MEHKNKNPRFAVEGNDLIVEQDNSSDLLELSQPTPKHISHYLEIALRNLESPQEEK